MKPYDDPNINPDSALYQLPNGCIVAVPIELTEELNCLKARVVQNVPGGHMPKILKLIHKCKDCPNWRYYSGGTYECEEADKRPIHPDKGNEAPPAWCPLPNYPTA